MITIFNRSELLVTQDMEQFARVRDVLADNDIDYECRTVNLSGGNMLGLDTRHIFEYVIYVRRKDLDEAIYLMNKNWQ